MNLDVIYSITNQTGPGRVCFMDTQTLVFCPQFSTKLTLTSAPGSLTGSMCGSSVPTITMFTINFQPSRLNHEMACQW